MWKEWLGLDLRSLGLLRIAYGVLLLADLLHRSLTFREHYTRDGVMPLSEFLVQQDLAWRLWSVFYASDSPIFVAALLLFMAILALMLLLGYRTTLVTIALFILVSSLQMRNPYILHSGDTYLRLTLFWCCFLPWGKRFSVDSMISRQERDQDQEVYFSIAGVAYILQIGMVYGYNAVYKVGPHWTVDHSAIYYALSMEQLTLTLGKWLVGLEPLLRVATHTTWVFEAAVPLLLLLPFPWVRIFTILGLMCFHLGLALSVNLHIFPWVGILTPLGLLPALFWSSPKAQQLYCFLSKAPKGLESYLGSKAFQSQRKSEQFKRTGVWFREILAGLALTAVLFQTSYEWKTGAPPDHPFLDLRTFRLGQKWSLFAPNVDLRSFQHSVVGQTVSGQSVVFDEIGKRPHSRWFSFRENFQRNQASWQFQVYLNYVVDRWNRSNPEDPIAFAVYRLEVRPSQSEYRLGSSTSTVKAVYFP